MIAKTKLVDKARDELGDVLDDPADSVFKALSVWFENRPVIGKWQGGFFIDCYLIAPEVV